MSLVSNLSTLATRIGTEFKAIRTLISGSGTGDTSGLDTTATNLVDAINEVLDAVGTGGAIDLDGLTDVAITTPATGNTLRYNGTVFVNVDPTVYLQPLDSDLTAIAALTTTSFGRGLLALADAAALAGQVASSSLTVAGVIELATQAEVDTGTDAVRAVAPSTLASRLAAYAQPLDSDLTSIAALTTTSYGRAVLELANQAALMGLLSAATSTAQGIVELATDAETLTGTDTTRATTPANVKAATDALKTDILGAGVPAALDTLDELAAALGDDANFAATVTTSLGNKQPLDTDLTAIAALTSAANKLAYATGAGTWALTDLSAAGRALIDDADAAAQRATLSVYSTTEIGDPTTDFVATFEAGLA